MEQPALHLESALSQTTILGFAGVGFVMFVLRWTGRSLAKRWYRWEDGFFLAASLLTFLIYALTWTVRRRLHGVTRVSESTTGLPIGVAPPPAQLNSQAASYTLAMQVMSVIILPLYKVSLLANYRRLFEPGPSMMVIYGALAFVGLETLIAFIVPFARCQPLGDYLNATMPGQCASKSTLGMAIPEMFATVIVLGLPLFYIRRVQWRGSTITCAVFMVLFGLYTLITVCSAVAAGAETTDEYDVYQIYWDGLSTTSFAYMMLCCVPNMHPLCSARARAAGRAPKVRMETSPGGDLVPLKPIDRTYSEEV